MRSLLNSRMSSSNVAHEEVVEEEASDFSLGATQECKCPWCPKAFIDGASLKIHLGKIHATHSEHAARRKAEGSGRLACPIGCALLLASYESLLRHCTNEHEFRADHMNVRFVNEKEFKEWLDDVSAIAGVFVRKRGERKTADGSTMGDYHCVFDGKKRETPSTRAPDRAPYTRRISSKKLGFACPAYIRYTIEIDGSVSCRAQLQHFGHELKPGVRRPLRERRQKAMMEGLKLRHSRKRFDLMDGDGGYEEASSRLSHDDDYEVDEQGMVNLYSIASLEKSRFLSQSACASMDISFEEVLSIPHEHLRHIPLLIEKFNEIATAASHIESMLKAMGATAVVVAEDAEEDAEEIGEVARVADDKNDSKHERDVEEEEEEEAQFKLSRMQRIRKRPREAKVEVVEEDHPKAQNDIDESFDEELDVEEYNDNVAIEVVVGNE